jgi:hypothetical protein
MARALWRIALATGLLVTAGFAGAAEPPLAGCYERVYDAAHLAAHKGQLVVRATIAIAETKAYNTPIIADATLKLWLRGKDKKSFDSIGACTAEGGNLDCGGSISAAEAPTCRSKQDGPRQCRIDGGDAGGFKVEGKPDGVLVSIPKRLELVQEPYDGGPFLTLSSSNVENRAFLLKKTACPAAER